MRNVSGPALPSITPTTRTGRPGTPSLLPHPLPHVDTFDVSVYLYCCRVGVLSYSGQAFPVATHLHQKVSHYLSSSVRSGVLSCRPRVSLPLTPLPLHAAVRL